MGVPCASMPEMIRDDMRRRVSLKLVVKKNDLPECESSLDVSIPQIWAFFKGKQFSTTAQREMRNISNYVLMMAFAICRKL